MCMNIVHFAIGLPMVLCTVFVVNIHSCLVVFDLHTSWLNLGLFVFSLYAVYTEHVNYHSVSGERWWLMVVNR